MKYFFAFIGISGLICIVLGNVVLRIYTTPQASTTSTVAKQLAFDDYSRRQFLAQNKLFIFVYVQVFGNRDKYKYFPPRILTTHTIKGQVGYTIHGLVSTWNPETKLLQVSS